MHRLRLLLLPAGLTLLLTACGGGAAGAPPAGQSPAAGSPGTGGSAAEVRIRAKDLKFDPTQLTVAANKPFTLVFENQEAAPHNVHITDPSGRDVSSGEVFSGPAERSQEVPALAAGAYTFICDVHPDMKGTITAQ